MAVLLIEGDRCPFFIFFCIKHFNFQCHHERNRAVHEHSASLRDHPEFGRGQYVECGVQ